MLETQTSSHLMKRPASHKGGQYFVRMAMYLRHLVSVPVFVMCRSCSPKSFLLERPTGLQVK